VNEGIGFLENSYTLASSDVFTGAVNADVAAGANRNDAALKNRNLLQGRKPTYYATGKYKFI
jgi:hypothetical protein